jgi:tripartite-type tricarboxylate transporter receptor subunit TctC
MKVIVKRGLLTLAALMIVTTGAFAQSYPNRPVKVIVGYVPGGGIDIMARTLSQKLSHILGQPFIVENKPGAGGTLAASFVAKSAPDGYTLLLGETSQLVIAPHTYKALNYDPVKDLTPVALVTTTSLVLVSNPQTSIRTLQDLVREAKANPGKLSYGSSGIGSIHHLSMKMFEVGAGLDMMHIPYKGSGQSIQAVLAGEVPLLLTSMTAAGSHIRVGKLNLLGTTSATRMPTHPDVPSLAEVVKDYDFSVENGILAPPGLAPDVLTRLSAAIKQAVESPEFMEKIRETPGTAITWTTPQGYAENLRQNLKKYERAVKLANLQPE